MSKKIVIIGGGIAGLSCAHILSTKLKNQNYIIELYEMEKNLGGKVQVYEKDNKYYQEHSPRVFLNNYVNLQNIFSDIPYDDNNSLLDMYSDELKNYLITEKCDKKPIYLTDVKQLLKNTNIFNMALIGLFLIQGFMSCQERLDDSFDKIPFSNLLFTKNTKYIFEYISYIIGENLNVLPFTKILKIIEFELKEKIEGYPVKYKGTRTFKIPYSEVFEKWEEYLLKNNVKIFKNYQLIDKKIYNNEIKEFIFKHDNSYKNVKCDIGILGLNISSLESFFSNTDSVLKEKLKKLKNETKSIQPGVQLHFDKKIQMKKYGYFVLDTDWKMIVAPMDNFWNKDDNKSVWSINIANPDLKSKRLNKTLMECNENEIKDEVWYQIKNSCVDKFIENKENFKNIIPNILLWKNLIFKNNKISKDETNDDYFWNSIGTNKDRPEQKTDIKNLYLTGALTKTNFYAYWTEGAVESAYKTVNEITKQNLNYYKHERPIIFLPFNIIDRFLYLFNLPNIFISSFIIFISYLIIKYLKFNI